MKKIITVLIIIAIMAKANAQNGEEWTRQKETQIKYLVEQIAAFQTYLDYLRQGYDIAIKGITIVQNIKNGEWNLHKDFLGSLKMINPSIKNYAKVADIIAMQVRLIRRANALIEKCRQSGQFTFEELDYLQGVCNRLLSECLKNIDELVMVITSGELQMMDDERLKRIENLYMDIQQKQEFFGSFDSSLIRLSKNRLREKLEIGLSKKLNRVK
jgi:hypothetical protein